MTIRILSQEELSTERGKTSTVGQIPPLLFSAPAHLYRRRAERLSALAVKHPFGDYLRFAATLANAQHHAQHDHPLPEGERQQLAHALATQQAAATDNLLISPARANARRAPLAHLPRLGADLDPRDESNPHRHWQQLLHAIIAELLPQADEPVRSVLENLAKTSAGELDTLASALLEYDFNVVGSDKAPFIWAALGVYRAQCAAALSSLGQAQADYGEARQHCPVCGCVPVCGVVHLGTQAGLRYLHCALCESEWHVVRVKCSNCEQTGKLDYWSLDSEQAAVKAESCGDCGSYIKLLYQEKDPQVEAVADDLASLFLDAQLEEKGLLRSTLNPLVFPAGE
nr:formate dehydrogenase accessory protein FdhE [Plesiomonas shigelloides]